MAVRRKPAGDEPGPDGRRAGTKANTSGHLKGVGAATVGKTTKATQARKPAVKPKRAPRKPPPKAPRKATRKRPPRRPVWESAFLAALANTGNVRAACQAAKIGRTTVYKHREVSPAFDVAWQVAIDEAVEVLEAEALRRAVHGTREPVYYKGKIVGQVLKYSDVLLIFLMKAARPDKYRERFEHVGRNGGPIEVYDARPVVGARLDQIAAGLREAAGSGGAAGAPDGGAQPAEG